MNGYWWVIVYNKMTTLLMGLYSVIQTLYYGPSRAVSWGYDILDIHWLAKCSQKYSTYDLFLILYIWGLGRAGVDTKRKCQGWGLLVLKKSWLSLQLLFLHKIWNGINFRAIFSNFETNTQIFGWISTSSLKQNHWVHSAHSIWILQLWAPPGEKKRT